MACGRENEEDRRTRKFWLIITEYMIVPVTEGILKEDEVRREDNEFR